MKKIVSVQLMLFICLQSFAQGESLENMTQPVGFVIVYASKTYKSAKKVALTAAKKLNYKLDFRGLEDTPKSGLSFSKAECESAGFDYPFCVPRGRGDHGKFVSVEYTDDYAGFSPGYYIVIVADFAKGNAELKSTLKQVKKEYPTAYIKYSNIYMGCLH